MMKIAGRTTSDCNIAEAQVQQEGDWKTDVVEDGGQHERVADRGHVEAPWGPVLTTFAETSKDANAGELASEV